MQDLYDSFAVYLEQLPCDSQNVRVRPTESHATGCGQRYEMEPARRAMLSREVRRTTVDDEIPASPICTTLPQFLEFGYEISWRFSVR